jgi:predicted DCC family thiol-disulfide oxidoreductase YuxK
MDELIIPGGRLLVIFDGHCGMCNAAVQWFLRRDRFDRLRFVASTSPKVASLLERHGIDPAEAESDSGSVVVAQALGTPHEHLLTRSEALLAILQQLPDPWWPAIGATLRIIPRPLRDLGYRLVAWSRYRIWKRLDACPIPTAEERMRFL